MSKGKNTTERTRRATNARNRDTTYYLSRANGDSLLRHLKRARREQMSLDLLGELGLNILMALVFLTGVGVIL